MEKRIIQPIRTLQDKGSLLNTKVDSSNWSILQHSLRSQETMEENECHMHAVSSSETNTPESAPQLPQATEEEDTPYPMKAQPKGYCLIVNNFDFFRSGRAQSQWMGTDIDEESLRRVFTWLGFQVEVLRDLTRDQMLSSMRELASRDHSGMDCVAYVVLSHGLEGGVYGVDGKVVRLKELADFLNGVRCASLRGKPKLFFIQFPSSTGDLCSDAVEASEWIATSADFLTAMATTPSYLSMRVEDRGSWFIQSLCQNLVKLVQRGQDLTSILMTVNKDVSKKSNRIGGRRQMPKHHTSLRTRLVFPVPEGPLPSLPTSPYKPRNQGCDYLTKMHPDLCRTLDLTPIALRFGSLIRQESPGLMSPSLPLEMHEGDSELGTSLTEAIANMSLTDRYEEEDGSDSVLSFFPDTSAEIDEVDKDDEEEMHFKSHCEKCKAAQQSPEYEKVTPTKISKWSFEVQLEGEGSYECSATGLVFEVSEQALVRYSVLTWSEFSEFLQDSWRPAGSIYDVDVVNKHPSALNKDSSVLKFIHFPHSLCLPEPEHELSFSVLHVKGSHASIESTVDFTASHVKWRVSSLSPGGVIIPSSRQGTHHGAVLVYKEGNHKYFFQVYLGVNSDSEIKAIEEQVNKSRKKCIRIYKPAPCNSQLVAGKNYHLTSKPEGKVEPSELNFNTDVIGLKGFSEARFDERPPFRLFLRASVNKKRRNCDKPLWSATITEEDLNSEEPNIGQKEHVKNTSADLMTSGSSGEESLSMSELSSPMDCWSSFPHERSRSSHGLVQNRSKPVKKKSSCSSGRGSPPGELSSSPPPKMPKSDDTLDTNRGQALSGMQLLQVAETLGQEWGRAGIYLGLSTTDLDDIMAEKTDVTMQKLKMLELWQRRTPGEATAQDLLRGLQALKDLPVETRQLLRDMMNGSLTLPDHKANA